MLGFFYIAFIFINTFPLIDVSFFHFYSSIGILLSAVFLALPLLCYSKINRNSCVYICIMICYLFFSISLNGGGIGSVLITVFSILFYLIYSNSYFTLKAETSLKIIGFFTVLFLFIYSVPYKEKWDVYQYTKINPNILSSYIMYFFMIICILKKTKKAKIPMLFMLGLSLVGINNYRSRGAMLALLFFLLLICLPQKYCTPRCFNVITILLIFIGTVFPILYMYLYRNNVPVEFLGKSLYTGRQKIWNNMFAYFEEDLGGVLFGLGSHILLEPYKSLNAHNNYFCFVVNFGVVGYLIYYFFVVSCIYKLSRYILNPVVKKGLAMFISSNLLLGLTESTLLWSVSLPFAYFGLIVANSEIKRMTKMELTAVL